VGGGGGDGKRRSWRGEHNITYSFIENCQTAVVHKNKTKRRSKIYKSQYIFRYNILTGGGEGGREGKWYPHFWGESYAHV